MSRQIGLLKRDLSYPNLTLLCPPLSNTKRILYSKLQINRASIYGDTAVGHHRPLGVDIDHFENPWLRATTTLLILNHDQVTRMKSELQPLSEILSLNYGRSLSLDKFIVHQPTSWQRLDGIVEYRRVPERSDNVLKRITEELNCEVRHQYF
ncbi:hypothetical protein TNCV_1883481 [Trichonephila clavipes]|nr:hypothetical protein TNCV_1883481 [Trichonephila clavipes]